MNTSRCHSDSVTRLQHSKGILAQLLVIRYANTNCWFTLMIFWWRQIPLGHICKLLSRNLLELRLNKCKFLQSSIIYLRYLISSTQIRPNPDNVSVIVNYPVPRSTKEVHRFIRLASYFRKFIANFSTIAKPLHDHLKKNAYFKFDEQECYVFFSSTFFLPFFLFLPVLGFL